MWNTLKISEFPNVTLLFFFCLLMCVVYICVFNPCSRHTCISFLSLLLLFGVCGVRTMVVGCVKHHNMLLYLPTCSNIIYVWIFSYFSFIFIKTTRRMKQKTIHTYTYTYTHTHEPIKIIYRTLKKYITFLYLFIIIWHMRTMDWVMCFIHTYVHIFIYICDTYPCPYKLQEKNY